MGRALWGFSMVWGMSVFAAGCTSVSSNYTGEITRTSTERVYVCSGYNCSHKTRLDLGAPDARRFAAIMRSGRQSPQAERAAVSRAVQYFEERATQAIGVRDRAKSLFGESRHLGQMDCIDESTNTRSLLLYLAERKLLRHHEVERNVSRGAFVDRRYPHSTAVVRAPDGIRWAVDSWYEPAGGPPDIMPLDEWKTRGVLGER